MAVQRVRLFFKLSLMQLVTASLLICMVPTISNAEESMCKGLKPFSNLDELLYQFYINLDSDCLFTMPVAELEKVWNIKILSQDCLEAGQYLYQLRGSIDFDNKPYKSEKDAFFVEVSHRHNTPNLNEFRIIITKEYKDRYTTLFPDGNYPKFLPDPQKKAEFKERYYAGPPKPERRPLNPGKYRGIDDNIYYWISSDRTRTIVLNGGDWSISDVTVSKHKAININDR